MVRPRKHRIITSKIKPAVFKPVEKCSSNIAEVFVGLDEMEALRLTNLEHLSQAETAERMGISRQLVGLMLSNVRKKLTEALTTGKAINIGEHNK